jgi:hypothetical protein
MTPYGFHVAFYIAGTKENLTLFGDKQGGDQVCEKNFAGHTWKGFRWPL